MNKILEQKLREIIQEQLNLLEGDYDSAFSEEEEENFITIIKKYAGVTPIRHRVTNFALEFKFNNFGEYKYAKNVIEKLGYKTSLGHYMSKDILVIKNKEQLSLLEANEDNTISAHEQRNSDMDILRKLFKKHGDIKYKSMWHHPGNNALGISFNNKTESEKSLKIFKAIGYKILTIDDVVQNRELKEVIIRITKI